MNVRFCRGSSNSKKTLAHRLSRSKWERNPCAADSTQTVVFVAFICDVGLELGQNGGHEAEEEGDEEGLHVGCSVY